MIIYIEGLSGVGKSTLIQEFKREDVFKVPEYISKPENIYNDLTCMKNDESKIDLALKNSNKVVLVDRGYLSTLVYGMVRYELTGRKERVDHIFEWIIKEMDKKLKRPDMYIWIDTPNDICLERAKKVNEIPENDYWYKDLDLNRYWYIRFFETIERDVPLHKLDGTKSIEFNLNKLQKIIDEGTTN